VGARNRLVVRGFGLAALVAVAGGCGGSGSSGGADSGSHSGTSSGSTSGSSGSSSGGSASGSGSSSSGGSGGGCVPQTCQSLGYECGTNVDGCNHVIDCGTCEGGKYCGGGGYRKCGGVGPQQCGIPLCVPITCQTSDIECGNWGDACGGLLECGQCPPSETCGSDGKCLWPADAGPCVPATCTSLGYGCGPFPDGCGGWLDCGTCPVDQFCGGGGAQQCGGTCSIADGGCSLVCSSPGGAGCTSYGVCNEYPRCGTAPNGCGGMIDCGPCGGDAGKPDAPAD
jgi:hypothetical protein